MTIWSGPVPFDTGSDKISWKPLKSPPHIYSCFLCRSSIWWNASHDDTLRSHLPLNRKCYNVSKTTEIPTPKPFIFLFLVSSSRWWYVGHNHTKWSQGRPLLNRKCPLFLKLLRSPPLNHRYKPVGLPGSDLPCTLHKIVCKCHKRK
jgi:hypothetical protein